MRTNVHQILQNDYEPKQAISNQYLMPTPPTQKCQKSTGFSLHFQIKPLGLLFKSPIRHKHQSPYSNSYTFWILDHSLKWLLQELSLFNGNYSISDIAGELNLPLTDVWSDEMLYFYIYIRLCDKNVGIHINNINHLLDT